MSFYADFEPASILYHVLHIPFFIHSILFMPKLLNTHLHHRFIKDDFDIKRTLGVGAYGFVKLVRWNRAPPSQQNFYYALKCVSKLKIEEKKQQLKVKRNY